MASEEKVEDTSPTAEAEAPKSESNRTGFSRPKLTTPKLRLPGAALARASRAVSAMVRGDTTESDKAPDEPVKDEKSQPDSSAEVETSAEAETAETEPVVEDQSEEPAAEASGDAPAEIDSSDEIVEPEPEPEPVAPKRTVATKPKKKPKKKAAGAVLSIRGLTKRYGSTLAVDEIDLDVPAGTIYGIVGPNGAGKTTTLSMVTGLLRPDAGTVTVHDADVWTDPVAAKRQMGVLPDRLRLFDRLTGSQLLYYSGVLRGLSGSETRKRSADLARAFSLEEALGRLVGDYSAGMTKKIALAAAMIHSPRLLVLDEPFESVDPVSAATVTDILRSYSAAGGTVVLSSHSMTLVERTCDSVAVVVGGKVLADGTVDEVRGGSTLEERFVELARSGVAQEGIEWLHSFSD